MSRILPSLFPRDRLPFAAALILMSSKIGLTPSNHGEQQPIQNDKENNDTRVGKLGIVHQALNETLFRLEKNH